MRSRATAFLVLAGLLVAFAAPVRAGPDGLRVIETQHSFEQLENRLAEAIERADMLQVFKASASRFARTRGVDIPGNSVYGVFRNDFAVRMIRANPLAGTEAPILFQVMENAEGSATLTYKTPSAIFAPYDDPGGELRKMAAELNAIFEMIAAEAAAD